MSRQAQFAELTVFIKFNTSHPLGNYIHMDDNTFNELIHKFELAKDLRKANTEDIDSIAQVLSYKLEHIILGSDASRDHFTEILDSIESELKERIEIEFSSESNLEKIKDKVEKDKELANYLTLAKAAMSKIEGLIAYIDEDEPDEYAFEFASLVVETINVLNQLTISSDVIPLLQRGVYSSSIASAIATWNENRHIEANNERFWQRELQSNRKILEHMFGGYAQFLQSEFHVGSTDIQGKGSKRTDFTLLHEINSNINIIEIKAPATQLLGTKYRDTYPLSNEVSGAISQILIQKSELLTNFHQKRYLSETTFEVFAPRCLLIAGSLYSLKSDTKKQRAFEIQREAISSHVKIVTFDELYEQFSRFNYAV